MGELKHKASRYVQSFDGPSPLADAGSRASKAAKIRAVLAEEGALIDPQACILDIGCSYGHILKHITPAGGTGVGIDIDDCFAAPADNLTFVRADAEQLPFRDGSFDVIVCNHVYEHTDDAHRLLDEIARVLKQDGVCYFAGPNKYDPVEPHYGLPFLSWLPRTWADRYVRLAGKGQGYPEKPFSPRRIRGLLRGFDVVTYTGRILDDPEKYEATDILPVRSAKRAIAKFVYRFAPFFFPGFVLVLRKPVRPA